MLIKRKVIGLSLLASTFTTSILANEQVVSLFYKAYYESPVYNLQREPDNTGSDPEMRAVKLKATMLLGYNKCKAQGAMVNLEIKETVPTPPSEMQQNQQNSQSRQNAPQTIYVEGVRYVPNIPDRICTEEHDPIFMEVAGTVKFKEGDQVVVLNTRTLPLPTPTPEDE